MSICNKNCNVCMSLNVRTNGKLVEYNCIRYGYQVSSCDFLHIKEFNTLNLESFKDSSEYERC